MIEPIALKQLHMMLERPEGCDAWLTDAQFVVQYGWHLAHHKYFVDVAPPVLAWLEANVRDGYLPAGTLPWWFPTDHAAREDIAGFDVISTGPTITSSSLGADWSYGARRVWIEREPGRTTIMIRDARTHGPARPQPLEPPKQYVPGAHACKHCGVTPDRYRVLGDALVCLACGASHEP